jgi:zinc transporter ZupT
LERSREDSRGEEMKRILIFIGLKLWEIGKVVAMIIGGLLFIFGGWFLAETYKPVKVTLIVILGVVGLGMLIFLSIEEIIPWIKSNWDKAGRIADETKTKI